MTVSDVESVQNQIKAKIVEGHSWRVEYPDPNDATDPKEYSVVNLYKDNEYQDEVKILLREEDGVFETHEYMDRDITNEFRTVQSVIDYVNRLVTE